MARFLSLTSAVLSVIGLGLLAVGELSPQDKRSIVLSFLTQNVSYPLLLD